MSLATEPNTGSVVDGIAGRFAEWDARRREQLDAAIRATKSDVRAETDRVAVPLEPLPGEPRPPAPPAPAKAKGFAPGSPPHDPINLPVRPAPVNEPARPAEEQPMPKGVRAGGPCTGCGAKGNRCKEDCPTRGKPKSGIRETKAAARETKEAPVKAPAARVAPKKRALHPESAVVDLITGLSVEQLVEARGEIDRLLEVRKADLQEQLAAIRGALGMDAEPGRA